MLINTYRHMKEKNREDKASKQMGKMWKTGESG